MTGDPTGPTFHLEEHGTAPHRLAILTAAEEDWVTRLAQIYRELRSAHRLPEPTKTIAPGLNRVAVLDVTAIERRMLETQIAARQGGNFDVLRSDFAEVLLWHVGQAYGKFRYGYVSLRDRESAGQPGRGVDQIGIRLDDNDQVRLMLGEAKFSTEDRHPPRVVDGTDDCLSAAHEKHLTQRHSTSERLYQAMRHCIDEETYQLFAIAAGKFDAGDTGLLIHLTSLLVRPKRLVSPRDFGSYAVPSESFSDCIIDFYLVSAETDDIDTMISDFAEQAKIPKRHH